MLVVMLALPALHGQDSQKGDKPPATAKAKFDALVKEYAAEQQKLRPAITKAKGEERQKLIEEYMSFGKQYAEKIFKIAEDHPKDPAAVDATFWVLQNAAGSPVQAKAEAKAKDVIAEMPLEDLVRRLSSLRVVNPTLQSAALERAQKETDDPKAVELLAWVAGGSTTPNGQKALELLVQKYPDHAAVERVLRSIARTPGAEDTLKSILEKASQPKIKAIVAISLAQLLGRQTDSVADKPEELDKLVKEGEKYLTQAIELLGKDNEELARQAEMELKALRNIPNLLVGKVVPEITAEDIDGKQFKLSDYRGKVVLLDFWGHW